MPFRVNFTGALASVTLDGFTVVALNVTVLKIATGTTPLEPRLIVFG
jgi:hypothetical protein